MAKALSLANLRKRVLAAVLDVLTSVFCVAYWEGVWSMLDALDVNHVISGVAALVIVFMLALVAANQLLEAWAKVWHPVVCNMVAWCWTFCLAVFSLVIWRACWWSIDEQVFDPDSLKAEARVFGTPGKAQMSNVHAFLLAMLGACILIATGRFRSASHAPPVGVVVDRYVAGGRFAKASFTGSNVKDVLIDFALTLPVVFVWAGIWMCFDNLKVLALLSATLCSAVIAVCASCEVDAHLRGACEGFPTMARNVADVVFTSILVLLVVGMWRGVWEAIDYQLELVKHPQFAAGLALAGAAGLTCLQRHRSAIFPPIDFSTDDGDHFAKVGNTEPELLLADHPLKAPQTGPYNTFGAWSGPSVARS